MTIELSNDSAPQHIKMMLEVVSSPHKLSPTLWTDLEIVLYNVEIFIRLSYPHRLVRLARSAQKVTIETEKNDSILLEFLQANLLNSNVC